METKHNSGKIGIKYAMGVALFALFLLFIQYFYIGIILKQEAEYDAKELALHTAHQIANSVEVYFRDALIITQTYAFNFRVYRQNKLPRYTIYKLMEGSIALNNNFLAIWTMWEPNAYDNNDAFYKNDSIHDPKGSFAIAYYYQGKEIMRELNDTADYYEDFYTIPKKFRRPVILDPFYYQYHGNQKTYFETSLISPITENNVFLGVIGIDIDMYSLQAKYNKIRVYDEGFISILSNSGNIVTHKNQKYIEKNIINYTKSEKLFIADSLKSGKAFSSESISAFSGEEVVRYFYPINIDYMAAPWYIMIEIPKRKIFEETKSLKLYSTIFLLASLLLISYLIYNIVDRRMQVNTLISTLKKVEDSESRIKEAYELLSKNEKILEAIFNQTYIFVGLLTNEGKIFRINKTALDFVNKNEAELINLDFSECPCWEKDPVAKNKLLDSIENAKKGIHSTFETIHFNSKGKSITILFSIKPIYDNNGEIVFLLPEGVDITRIKETERELKKYQEHLEELVFERTNEIQQLNEELTASNEELLTVNEQIIAQKEKLTQTLVELRKTQEQLIISEKLASLGLFTAGIAHEINNPINFISAGTQALFEQLNHLMGFEFAKNEDFQKFISIANSIKRSIEIGIERTTEIVSSLRNYSSVNSDIMVNYPIDKTIKDALIILRSKYKNHIEIIENYDSNGMIECAPGKLNQVFVNLISNAIDAIKEEGKIYISTKSLGDEIEIMITDSGEGIEKENIAKLFDPFFTTKPVGKGVGLGLYIVYGIIKQHDGEIKIQSENGKGTTIIITLPYKHL